MRAHELIKSFLKFFKRRGHAIIPPASVVPENDPTVLFTTAGMHPLVPYLLGQPHPQGRRLADVQPCIRTGDIDSVGDDTHLTFFEMLGNWSLGDYFKREAIQYSFEFLTGSQWLGIPLERLAVSVFAGDEDAPRDDESVNLWRAAGVPVARIVELGKDDNWWPAGGKHPGPQGPDTEMFYWTGTGKAPRHFDPNDPRWVEIWNNVFMQYRKTEAGKFEPLQQQNVDTGMGVERTVAVLNGQTSVYGTDVFAGPLEVIRSMMGKKDERIARIIVDHLRAATVILADPSGVVPSNVERGYVLRRLIRRAIRFGRSVGIRDNFTEAIASACIRQLAERYAWVSKNAATIRRQLNAEWEQFDETLNRGLAQLEKRASGRAISGRVAFDLYATYGFPIEAVEDWAKEHGAVVDRKSYEAELAKHQELSRTAKAGRFRSGLADTSAESTKLHTATHLLHAALRQVLGRHVQQKGSNITPERLRFDFSHSAKVTLLELKRVEDLVNEQIRRALEVRREEMSPAEAKRQGALGFFATKYADRISVYTIGDFSQEICTGPHVRNTAELGHFRIIREEPCAAGVRRIKAIVERPEGAEQV